MLDSTPTVFAFGQDQMLYVAELLHRVNNEYTSAILLASQLASKSSSQEVKSALEKVSGHLTDLTRVHRVLSPPVAEGSSDLGNYLNRLCEAKLVELEWRSMTVHLVIESAVPLDNARCWQAGLVVSELITNAMRHGPASGADRILVSLVEEAGQVLCRVTDNGRGAETFRPGLGTRLVDTLAKELNGRVERRSGESGTAITLSFPLDSDLQLSLRPVVQSDRLLFKKA
jgi:two-component sensor histidine kinase